MAMFLGVGRDEKKQYGCGAPSTLIDASNLIKSLCYYDTGSWGSTWQVTNSPESMFWRTDIPVSRLVYIWTALSDRWPALHKFPRVFLRTFLGIHGVPEGWFRGGLWLKSYLCSGCPGFAWAFTLCCSIHMATWGASELFACKPSHDLLLNTYWLWAGLG